MFCGWWEKVMRNKLSCSAYDGKTYLSLLLKILIWTTFAPETLIYNYINELFLVYPFPEYLQEGNRALQEIYYGETWMVLLAVLQNVGEQCGMIPC